MSARENLLRKSCRAPANNHFIYVSHRQHSCGKKDLYQRFSTTDENVTLSAHTRLPSFLADRQSAVLKRPKEVLGGNNRLHGSYPETGFEEIRSVAAIGGDAFLPRSEERRVGQRWNFSE